MDDAIQSLNDNSTCRYCGGRLYIKTMLWYGSVEKRCKCSQCGMIY
jgi:hypothetical protein